MRSLPKDSSPLRISLEAVSATSGVMPWGVASLDSCEMVLCWDSRPDASGAILEAIASQIGEVGESMTLDRSPQSIVGLLVSPFDPLRDVHSLEDIAGMLRGLIAVGLSSDPDRTENPF